MAESFNHSRLIKDITNLYKHPLNHHGIYYVHDDTNMLKGYSMIIGPKETVYNHGFYFFEFNFPEDYPHSPPVVKIINTDTSVRFHPNLYRCGKVCLSILNTWYGEGWTSCQTIKSVLLTLISILDNEPLLHEPNIFKHHPDFYKYNDIVRYKNVEISILKVKSSPFYNKFKNHIDTYLINNRDEILQFVEKECVKTPYRNGHIILTYLYNMTISVKWDETLIKVKEFFTTIND